MLNKRVTAIIIMMVFSIVVKSQTDSVYYHTYKFTTQYGAGGNFPYEDYYGFATRFTPPYYPAKLAGIKAWFRNAASPSYCKFIVYKDPAGTASGPTSVTPDYLTPFSIPNPSTGGVEDSAYSYFENLLSQNIIISSGDVYCGVTQTLMTNGFVGIAIDTANNFPTNRPWALVGTWWVQMLSWTFSDGEWGITAYFKPTTSADIQDIQDPQTIIEVSPQPATDHAQITFRLGVDSPVSVSVLNTAGTEVKKLDSPETRDAGIHSVPIFTGDLPSGIYFIRLQTPGYIAVRKLVKL